MTIDSREVAWEWASAKGWALEIAGSAITVRDGSNYVMAEMDFSPTQHSPFRSAMTVAEVERSTFHVAVTLCGLSSAAMRWQLRSPSRLRSLPPAASPRHRI